jgi:hypothetical protein
MNFISSRMLRYKKIYSTCKHEFTNDFSYYESFGDTKKISHIYCPNCCVRWWKDKEYNPNEWDAYING